MDHSGLRCRAEQKLLSEPAEVLAISYKSVVYMWTISSDQSRDREGVSGQSRDREGV